MNSQFHFFKYILDRVFQKVFSDLEILFRMFTLDYIKKYISNWIFLKVFQNSETHSKIPGWEIFLYFGEFLNSKISFRTLNSKCKKKRKSKQIF